MPNDDGKIVNEPLIAVLEALGVIAKPGDDWVGLPAGKRIRAVVWDRETGSADIFMVRLEVVMEVWTGRRVVESTVGYGSSRDEAIGAAFESFAESSLTPMLVAFVRTEHQVVRDAWEIDGVMRAVTIGGASIRGKPPGGSKMDMGWFSAFRHELEAASVPAGTHWISLYYAQQNGETVAVEVLLDNEPWPAMREAMGGRAFPLGPDFYSLRLFVVVQGGLDVSRAIARMIELAARPDAEIAGVLADDGADTREVQALLAYLPLAFGRVALEDLPVRFSDTAIAKETPDHEGERIRLVDERIFAEAKHIASSALQRGAMTEDQFLAVALRSAELHAINNAMGGGAQAEDLVVSAPVVTLY